MSRASAAANAKIRFLCTVVRSFLGTLGEETWRPQLQASEGIWSVLKGACWAVQTCLDNVWSFYYSLQRCQSKEAKDCHGAQALGAGKHSALPLASALRDRQGVGGGFTAILTQGRSLCLLSEKQSLHCLFYKNELYRSSFYGKQCLCDKCLSTGTEVWAQLM